MAQPAQIDFSQLNEVDLDSLPASAKFNNGRVKKLSAKQIRARARRKSKKSTAAMGEELALLHKPLEEWDAEELARGRPRASDGTFKGKAPDWIPRAVHEQALEKYKEIIKGDLNGHALKAIKTLEKILDNEGEDDKGRPLVPASTKLDASKFILEQLLGKPKQEVTADISVKLQGILAAASVAGPEALMAGAIDVDSWEEDDDVAELVE